MRVEFTALRSRIACSTIWASQALPHAPDFVLQAVEGGNRPRSDGWSGNWRAQDRSWECSWEVQASHSEKRVLPAVSIGKELAFRLVHLWDSWGLDRDLDCSASKHLPLGSTHGGGSLLWLQTSFSSGYLVIKCSATLQRSLMKTFTWVELNFTCLDLVSPPVFPCYSSESLWIQTKELGESVSWSKLRL